MRRSYWAIAMKLAAIVTFCMALTGCGDGLSRVSGTVTLDGSPIAVGKQMNGTVNFVREDGSGARATGYIDETGRYALTTGAKNGIEPGTYLVGIAVNQVTIPADPAAMPQPKLITPRKYSNSRDSGLKAEVKPGKNTFDFALSSK